MASARQLSKDAGLRSATNRQKLKPQLSGDSGSGLTRSVPGAAGDIVLPRTFGGDTAESPYMKEELVLKLGENFYNRIMVLVQQAARSSNEASFMDIAMGIYRDAEGYINKEGQMKSFALLLFLYALENVNNAETVAKLCATLAPLEAEGTKFRSPLLKKLQEDFTDRSAWTESDPDRWLAFSCFLCCLFRHLTIGDNHINALVEPVFSCLDSLLVDVLSSDEEMKCACNQLKAVGSILDEMKADQMGTLISLIKERLLGPHASHFGRLLLLEIIELRAGGWKLTDTQKQYYSEVFC